MCFFIVYVCARVRVCAPACVQATLACGFRDVSRYVCAQFACIHLCGRRLNVFMKTQALCGNPLSTNKDLMCLLICLYARSVHELVPFYLQKLH